MATTDFLEGFEAYQSIAQTLHFRWAAYNNTPTLGTGRGGGQCIVCVGSTTALQEYITSVAFTARATACVGFAYYYSGIASASTICSLFDGSTEHLRILRNANLTLSVARGDGTVLATSTANIIEGAWHYITLDYTINNSTGAVELKLDGVTIASASGVDTQNGGSAQVNVLRLSERAEASNTSYFDDVYVASANLGDNKVISLSPNGDDDATGWNITGDTLAYTVLADNSDSSFIDTDATNELARLNMGDLPVGYTVINAIQPVVRWDKSDAGTCTGRLNVKSGTTTDTGATKGLTETIVWFGGDILSQDPDTTADWDSSGVNAVQVEIERVS